MTRPRHPGPTGAVIDDEVQRTIDFLVPPPRSHARAWITGTLVATVLVGAIVLSYLGLFGAYVQDQGFVESHIDTVAHLVTYQTQLRNDAAFGADVEGVSSPDPNLEVRAVTPLPLHLAGRASATIDLEIRVRDCSLVRPPGSNHHEDVLAIDVGPRLGPNRRVSLTSSSGVMDFTYLACGPPLN
jgi:hypothetical protein